MKFEPEPERDAQTRPLKRLYRRVPRKIRLAVMSLVVVSVIIGVSYSMYQFNNWSKQWELKFQVPIQNFIRIEPRVTAQKHRFLAVAEAKEVEPAKMSTEDYICYVFGHDCRLALAVSQAENGTRQCDRFGVNTNKSIDAGIFQINSVHLKKGWKLSDLLDCHKNVDYAKQIFDAQGWEPWVAYTNGSYKKFLK
jgi:hypothetical protein